MKRSELTTGIAEIVQQLFFGSQTEFAARLGVGRYTVSKVLSGERAPSSAFLKKLSTLEQVNQEWLRTGKGKPIVADEKNATSAEKNTWTNQVPIFPFPLKQPIENYPTGQTVGSAFLPPSLSSPNVYAVRFRDCGEVDPTISRGYFPEDLLFVDTNIEPWLADPRSLENRLLVISSSETADAILTTTSLLMSRNPMKVFSRKRVLQLDDEPKTITKQKPIQTTKEFTKQFLKANRCTLAGVAIFMTRQEF